MAKKKEIIKVPNFEEIDISEVIKRDYLAFSASSFVRMVPSAIDGLKPSQRRIVYTMMKMHADDFTKSADVVGQSMQLIPHGDAAIYQTLVYLTQKDRTKNTLVEGQGNLGYITDSLSSYAASRYTEVKVSEYLKDMYFTEDFKFTDMMMTYKGIPEIQEPVFLPTLLPMILIQGANGITPGFSCRIIPHSLQSVGEAYIDYIKNRENPRAFPKMRKRILEKIEIDFPNKCVHPKNSEKGLDTGKGQVVVNGKYRIKDYSRGRKIIQVYQLPYMVEAPAFVDQCATIFKKHDMIFSVTDESSRDGFLINIILRKDVPLKKAVELLYTNTSFSTKLNYSMVLNKNTVPTRMGVLEIFEFHYTNKKRILLDYYNNQKDLLEYKKRCLDGSLYILGNTKRKNEFIKMLETSNKKTIIKNIKAKWNLDPEVADYLINKKFTSLLNGIEALVKEQSEVTKEYIQTEKILEDIDRYMIKRINEVIKKYGDK